MRILIATGLYTPDIGGPATYTRFLERVLPPRGFSLRVVSFSDVRHLPKIIRHLAYVWKLLRAGWGVDVIYALDTVSVGMPATIVSIILGKSLYVRVPGDYAWEQGQQRFGVRENLDEYLHTKKRPLPVRILAWLQYRVARRAQKIIVPSEYMKRVVAGWGIDGEKITRVYSALKVIAVPASREALRSQLGYTDFVIVTAARLVPWKGVAALIDAVAQLRSDGQAVSLSIIGDGTLRDALEAHAEKKGVRAQVRFYGTLERRVLGEHLKAADAFVLNTSYEGLSHQLLEVMHIGTPIITTPVGGNVELITHDHEGLLVSYNDTLKLVDALLTLIREPHTRERLVAEARARVELFHEDRVVEDFVRVVHTG